MIIQNLDSCDYPKLGPLPDSTVNFDFLYSSIGIDYAGLVYVRNIYNTKDNDLYKAWVVLVTCCSSRCTYLDIVPDCYGHSCINILKRFISVQGAPKLVISSSVFGAAVFRNQEYTHDLKIT